MRFHRSLRLQAVSLIPGLLGLLPLQAATGEECPYFDVKPISSAQATEYALKPDFYQKGIFIQNILIATSGKVSDLAIREAAYLFDKVMTGIHPDVARRIREKKVLCVLVAHNELTSDMPQFVSDKKGEELDFYNWRQRGFLSDVDGRKVVLFAEEDVLEYQGGMRLESILIHEFGHVIDGCGFDDAQRKRLKAAFENAKAKGIYQDGRAAQKFRRVSDVNPVILLDALVAAFPAQPRPFLAKCLDGGDILVNGKAADSRVTVTKRDEVLIVFGGPKDCYASKNPGEYWAEGVQDWYDTNRTMDHDHNHIHTRDQLKTYDPELAALCKEVLGDGEWRFVTPRDRAGCGHLDEYEPQTAPVVAKLPHIEKAANDYYDTYWKDYWSRLHTKYPDKTLLRPNVQ